MDTFLEYLFKKKNTAKETLMKLGIALATAIAMIIVFSLLMMVPFLNQLALLGAVGVVYGAYVILRNFDLEYEYIFTNGDLDIDVIKGRKARKRMISISCKDIVLMAPIDDPLHSAEFKNQSIIKKFDAIYDGAKGGIYGMIYIDTGEQRLLAFQPPENLVENMKKYNPRCIFK